MSIKYEIHTINNSQGTGENRHYAHIFENQPMSVKELETHIQDSCSLTKGDVEAAMSALRENMVRELSSGSRFYIPGIGYFSLSVDLDMPEGKPIEKVRADYISVRNIKFRPEASVLQDVRRNVRFEHATFTTKSRQHTEETLLAGIKEFLATHRCINRRDMELQFGLRQSAALKWLKHFTEKGILQKEGARNSPVYYLREQTNEHK